MRPVAATSSVHTLFGAVLPARQADRAAQAPVQMVWALTAHLPVFERPNTRRLQAPTMAAVERGFAATVAQQVRGGVLRYGDRQGLLRAADRLHIERFRANLLIALVQREMGHAATGRPLPAPTGAASDFAGTKRPYSRTLAWAGALLCVEAVAGIGAYWFCFH